MQFVQIRDFQTELQSAVLQLLSRVANNLAVNVTYGTRPTVDPVEFETHYDPDLVGASWDVLTTPTSF